MWWKTWSVVTYTILCIGLYCHMVFFPSDASATGTLKKLKLTPQSSLDFGLITKEKDQNVTQTITTSQSYHGEVLIKGGSDPSDTIDITLSKCGGESNYITLKDFTFSYGSEIWQLSGTGPFFKTDLPAPGSPGTTLKYGATAEINKEAPLGQVSPCLTVTVQYHCVLDANPCTPDPISTSTTQNAKLTVQGFPITITETESMSFGTLTFPTIKTKVRILPRHSTKVKIGDSQIIELGHPAQFIFEAEKNTSVTLSTRFLSANDPGIKLNRFRVSINGKRGKRPSRDAFQTRLDRTENSLALGAQLVIDPTLASPGHKELNYEISVDYE